MDTSTYTFRTDGSFDVIREEIKSMYDKEGKIVGTKVVLSFAKKLKHEQDDCFYAKTETPIKGVVGGPYSGLTMYNITTSSAMRIRKEEKIERALKDFYGQLKVVNGKACFFASSQKRVAEIESKDNVHFFLKKKKHVTRKLGKLDLEVLDQVTFEKNSQKAVNMVLNLLEEKSQIPNYPVQTEMPEKKISMTKNRIISSESKVKEKTENVVKKKVPFWKKFLPIQV